MSFPKKYIRKREIYFVSIDILLLFGMNPQLELILPIPIIEEIISLSTLDTKLVFGVTCKRFLQFIIIHFFPTLTTTFCGDVKGHEDGDLVHAQFNGPYFGVLNASSTTLFVSDYFNHAIRKMDMLTHKVTTLCGTPGEGGSRDGIRKEARFFFPTGLALNKNEDILYVADAYNHVIRRVYLIDDKVDTFVGKSRIMKNGIYKEVIFNTPNGLALDTISDFLYVADRGNYCIRRIALNEGKVETLCGKKWSGYKDGPFYDVIFNDPFDVVWNSKTQELYVSDYWNRAIRVLSLKEETVSTLCTQARFKYPSGLALDSHFQCLYVSDENHVIRRISLLGERKVDTLYGKPEIEGSKNGLVPTFYYPKGIVVDPRSHSLYIMDCRNNKVRKISDRKRALLES